MTQFYLDYNATSPLRPAAWQAMEKILLCGPLNASAIHACGRQGHKAIETARAQIAPLVGTDTNQIIFNSGATEGNNTVIRHFEKTYPDEVILVSAVEHPSILETSKNLEHIPVNASGLIDIAALEQRLQQAPKVCLVSVMMVNNESGVIQNIAEISTLAHRHGALFHTDATQAAGRIPVDMRETGIDFLTLSSHKLGGPQGVGALALGNCGQTPTLLLGGGQEKSARAGTENVAGIAGFGAAALESLEHLNHYQALGKWRDDMERRLIAISPDIIIHGHKGPRVANTTFFSLPAKDSQSLLIAFDLEGIALSNGSACSSGTVKPSHVLKAMGLNEKQTAGALRISTGWATKESDIAAFLTTWEKIYKTDQPMSKITVIEKNGTQKQIEAEDGWSLMEILRDAGFSEIEGACGGSMACATCHMYVHPDWQKKLNALDNEKSEEEEDMLDLAFQLTEYSRLGCQIRMSDALDGLVVAIPGAKIDW